MRLEEVHRDALGLDQGDSFLGECLSGETGDGAPLIFFGGRYGELTEESVQRAS